jgi:hypothetical protein
MATLRLGVVDSGKTPVNKAAFFKDFHRDMHPGLQNKLKFRDEANFKWSDFNEISGNEVLGLQSFLKEKGFFPNADLSGIFGYGTQSATRLFQEYVHSIEGDTSIGTPDGIAGSNTLAHMNRWKQNNVKNTWAQFSASNPSEEFTKWIGILNNAKTFYVSTPNPIMEQLTAKSGTSDSLAPRDWKFDPEDVHLIGIRRNEDETAAKRQNDDLLILLIKGMVFKFWGSTDPNAAVVNRSDEAFLVEGQHKYRFSWHKKGDAKKIYKALMPYSKGVLVFRDRTNSNSLTEADVIRGFDAPNTTINIHWSGDGHFNHSAGCQVISGRSYLDPFGKLVSCKSYSAPSYNDLENGKTRGAYNVLSDLVICYNKAGSDTVWYTLGREKNLRETNANLPSEFTKEMVEKLKAV